VTLHFSDDVEAYAAAVDGFLDAAPASRNLLRGLIDTARQGALTWTAAPGFWWIDAADQVVGCATWTPPYPMAVSTLPDRAAAELLRSARDRAQQIGVALPGVNGPRPAAEAVAAAWTDATGHGTTLQMAELLHEAGVLVEPARPPGAMRTAGAADVDVCLEWTLAFVVESGVMSGDQSRMRAVVEHTLSGGRCHLWDVDGEPVSMVAHQPHAPVVRIGPVYTPPQHRTRGYARRLTYEVTRRLLDTPGVDRASLYTDVANPVSNSIYRQIGYLPIEEHSVLLFDGA